MPRAAFRPVAVLGPVVLAAAAACGSATDPPAPASVASGRFVLGSVNGASLPLTVQGGAEYATTLLADTLWLAADGTAQQVQVTSTTVTTVGRSGTSTDVQRTAGAWRAAGAAVRVTATATFPTGASGADTLALTARPDGGLEAPAATTAYGAWVWQRR